MHIMGLIGYSGATRGNTGTGTLDVGGGPTQTIDLDRYTVDELHQTGSFELSGIASTSLGILFDGLPVPVLLVDESHRVVFANECCRRLSPSGDQFYGRTMADLLAAPPDSLRAAALEQKAEMMLDRIFLKRKPLMGEAILEFNRKRIWARLHLRAVKICRARYALVIIEDLTSERINARLLERENARLTRDNAKLKKHIRTLVERAAPGIGGGSGVSLTTEN